MSAPDPAPNVIFIPVLQGYRRMRRRFVIPIVDQSVFPAGERILVLRRELALYADGSVITFRDFQHLCTTDGRKIVPSVLAVYCDVLGIISFSPDQSGNRGLHKVDLNPLVHAALLRSE